jgi:hypothetical protein
MTANEFYYLVFVLASFGAFGIGLAISTLHYKSWLKVRTAQPQRVAYTARSNASNAVTARAS